ncbi:regulation of enolase protein 1-like [Spodoptera litura]|uniref:Regulation of enolase protein 1-like n=1 Tax=Spodoptera litura TaxID=69820 RepID=A0A9J7EHJ5_SPOLT|nr:regulation of enolase protein 1-like [Spodoptera litura]
MDSSKYNEISFNDFKWTNEPKNWKIVNQSLEVTTDDKSDYWQGPLGNRDHTTGHLYGIELKDDFHFEVCVEADFSHLYGQAGLMIYFDDKHWLKAGIEYMHDGQPMIGSVLTNERSDWGTGVFTGNPRKFYLRMSRKGDVACVKYSTDNELWTLLRLCPLPLCTRGPCVVGPMCCTPKREGLQVTFSNISITVPGDDILHSN